MINLTSRIPKISIWNFEESEGGTATCRTKGPLKDFGSGILDFRSQKTPLPRCPFKSEIQNHLHAPRRTRACGGAGSRGIIMADGYSAMDVLRRSRAN